MTSFDNSTNVDLETYLKQIEDSIRTVDLNVKQLSLLVNDIKSDVDRIQMYEIESVPDADNEPCYAGDVVYANSNKKGDGTAWKILEVREDELYNLYACKVSDSRCTRDLRSCWVTHKKSVYDKNNMFIAKNSVVYIVDDEFQCPKIVVDAYYDESGETSYVDVQDANAKDNSYITTYPSAKVSVKSQDVWSMYWWKVLEYVKDPKTADLLVDHAKSLHSYLRVSDNNLKTRR